MPTFAHRNHRFAFKLDLASRTIKNYSSSITARRSVERVNYAVRLCDRVSFASRNERPSIGCVYIVHNRCHVYTPRINGKNQHERVHGNPTGFSFCEFPRMSFNDRLHRTETTKKIRTSTVWSTFERRIEAMAGCR